MSSRLICSASEWVKCLIFTKFAFGSRALLGTSKEPQHHRYMTAILWFKISVCAWQKWISLPHLPQSVLLETCPSFWTDCIFQNCFLWLTDGNSLVMILLFIIINNLQTGMIKSSMWLFSFSHKEQKSVKPFTYCSSKKVSFENLGEKEERLIATTNIFISSKWCRAPWLWRHIERDIYAALHPAPVRI